MTAEILPQEDAEISQLARKSFEKQGIRVLTQCAVTASSPTATGVKVTLEQQGKRSELEVERVIVAAGIVGNIENLGLEGTRVRWKRATSSPTACAAPASRASTPSATWPARPGWRTRPAMKACVRGSHRRQAAHAIDPLRIPACTYSHPQVASIGMTEARAREHAARHGGEIRVASSPSPATARPSPWARTRAWSRPCSMPAPASCWARTSSTRKPRS